MSGNLGLLFFLKRGDHYLVKVGLLTRLDREFRGLTAAYGAMPTNVPEPLRLATCRSYQVLVTRGIRHRQLLPLRGAADVDVFEKGIASFLATGARAFRRSERAVSSGGLREALARASELVGWRGWEAYWEGIRSLAERLPPILQHGDFAVNNIGVREGALVFFDWEDFGEIDLPGFDVAVLLLSLNDFSMSALVAKLDAAGSVEADIVRSGCNSLGMSAADFMDLFPAYASLYISTKSRLGYPAAVTGRIAAALAEWIRLRGAGTVEPPLAPSGGRARMQ
jgi:hypothetical protein